MCKRITQVQRYISRANSLPAQIGIMDPGYQDDEFLVCEKTMFFCISAFARILIMTDYLILSGCQDLEMKPLGNLNKSPYLFRVRKFIGIVNDEFINNVRKAGNSTDYFKWFTIGFKYNARLVIIKYQDLIED